MSVLSLLWKHAFAPSNCILKNDDLLVCICIADDLGTMLVNSVEITEISVKLVNLKNSVKFSEIQIYAY